MSELPKGWKLSPLSELADVQAGIGFPKRFQGVTSAKYPVYKVGDLSRAYLNDKALVEKAENYVSEEVAAELKGKIFKEGAILFAKIGEALRLNRRVKVVREGLADNNVMAVVPKDCVDNNYLFRFLQYYDIASLSRSTTVPSIRKGDVENVSVPHPDLDEQKRIADKLDSVLAKVEAAQARLDKIPAILKRFRQSVLAAATSGELTREFRQDSLVQNEIMDSYFAPKEWKVTDFDSLTHFITSGSRGWAKYYSHSGATFIRAQNINSDSLNLEDVAYVSLPDRVEGRRTKVEIDDLLITITGANVTKTARVSQKIGEAYVSQHVALVKLKDKSISKFIEIFLKSESAGRGTLGKLAYGGGKPGLNLQNIKSLRVAIPDKNEMVAINEKIEQLTALAEKIEKQYDAASSRLDKLTQSILVKAFRGELLHTEVENEFLQELSDVEAVEC